MRNMYFVVFWDKWCATIPASWLIAKLKIFKWPPKNKNPTIESKKETKPQENWTTVSYSKLLGPFDTYEDAREAENNTLDISTNDEEKLTEITNKVKTVVPTKRHIQKPQRFLSTTSNSSSDGEENNKPKTKIKKSSQCLMQKTIYSMDKTAESACKNNKLPTNYKMSKGFTECHWVSDYAESNNNDGTKKQILERVGTSESYLHPSQNQEQDIPIEIQTEKDIVPYEDSFVTREDLYTMEPATISKAKPTIESVVVANMSLPIDILLCKDKKIDKKEKSSSHHEMQISHNDKKQERQENSHHECCRACRNDIKAILRTVTAVREILLDSTPYQSQEGNIDLNLPIFYVTQLHEFNKLLCDDSAARLQYQTMIRTTGGITPHKHVRNAMRLTIADTLTYQMTWTNQKHKIEVQSMKFISLIIDAIVTTRDISITDVQKVMKCWLQHAGDRISRTDRERIQNEVL